MSPVNKHFYFFLSNVDAFYLFMPKFPGRNLQYYATEAARMDFLVSNLVGQSIQPFIIDEMLTLLMLAVSLSCMALVMYACVLLSCIACHVWLMLKNVPSMP